MSVLRPLLLLSVWHLTLMVVVLVRAESPIQLACGGTCNAEMAAMFAPMPQLIVSDGGDWTSSVPRLEYPYLQRVYGFYDAVGKIENVHLPKERHDFRPE